MKYLILTMTLMSITLNSKAQSFIELAQNIGITEHISIKNSDTGFFVGMNNPSVMFNGRDVDYKPLQVDWNLKPARGISGKSEPILLFKSEGGNKNIGTIFRYSHDSGAFVHFKQTVDFGIIQRFDNVIIITGGRISSNLGDSWDTISYFPAGTAYSIFNFINSKEGFIRVHLPPVTQNFELYFTADGLKTFTKITPTGVPDDFVKGISRIDAINKDWLYAATGYALYHSTDGGKYWRFLDSMNFGSTPISKVNDSTAFRFISRRPTPQSIQFEMVRTRNREKAACVVDFPMSLGEIPRHMDCVNDSVCFVVTSQGQNYKLWKTTNGGGACKRVLWDSTSTGMAQHALPELGLSLYPNPSRDVFYAALSEPPAGPVSYSVTAIDGRMIMQHTISPQQYDAGGKLITLDMSGYAQGLYLLQLTTPHAQTVKKLMLQR